MFKDRSVKGNTKENDVTKGRQAPPPPPPKPPKARIIAEGRWGWKPEPPPYKIELQQNGYNDPEFMELMNLIYKAIIKG